MAREQKVIADRREMADARRAKRNLKIAGDLEELWVLAFHPEPPRVVAQVIDHLLKLATAEENRIDVTLGPMGNTPACRRSGRTIWPRARKGRGDLAPALGTARLEAADDRAKRLALRQRLFDEKHPVEMIGHQLGFDEGNLRPAGLDLSPTVQNDLAPL